MKIKKPRFLQNAVTVAGQKVFRIIMVSKADPFDYAPLVHAGESRMQGDFKKAEEWYSRVSSVSWTILIDYQFIARIEASSKDHSVYLMQQALNGRAEMRLRIDRLDDAIEDGNRMITVDERDPAVITL